MTGTQIRRVLLALTLVGSLAGCTVTGTPSVSGGPDASSLPEDMGRLFDATHDGDLERGRKAYRDADYFRALHELYPHAMEGHAESQRTLGVMFARGQGVSANSVFANYWLEKAAEQGDVEAQRLLGRYHHEGRFLERDRRKAANWFARAATNGNAEAQFYLSNLYQLGEGVEEASGKAHRWMKAAAEQGHLAARNNLGWMYQYGVGTEADLAEAERWYLKAAGDNLASAQYNLSLFYEQAPHPFHDREKARSWMQKAVASGHDGALRRLLQEPGSGDFDRASSLVLFGVPLAQADRELMRQRVERAGGIPLGTKNDQWYDAYEASDLLEGADRLFVGFSLRNAMVAELRYRLPGQNTPGGVARMIEKLQTRYGEPLIGGELYEFEGLHARWEVRGVEIEVRRNWPDDSLLVRYVLPDELEQLRQEQREHMPEGGVEPVLDTY